MSTPPPLPTSPPISPPKPGMSGCAIAAIVGAVLLVVAVPVVAILAAIAIPTYQDYIVKSQVLQATLAARELQETVDNHFQQSGGCPDIATLGANDTITSTSGQMIATLQAGALDDGRCAIELVFKPMAIAGQTLIFESTETGWTCISGDLGDKYRSADCR